MALLGKTKTSVQGLNGSEGVLSGFVESTRHCPTTIFRPGDMKCRTFWLIRSLSIIIEECQRNNDRFCGCVAGVSC